MREQLNWELLQEARRGLDKAAFVPMPGGQNGAPAGGAPMDPAAAGGMPPMDPAAAGGMPPMDPSMMGMPAGGGMPPMDPSMMGMPAGGDPMAGGMPPPGGDPAAAGMAPDPASMGLPPEAMAALAGGSSAGGGQIVMSIPEFLSYTQLIMGKGGGADGGKAPGATKKAGGTAELSAKLDQLLQAMGVGAPAPAPAPEAAPAQ